MVYLRVLPGFAEDPGSIPSKHIWFRIISLIPVSNRAFDEIFHHLETHTRYTNIIQDYSYTRNEYKYKKV